MTEQLVRLAAMADLDASGYVRGAQQVDDANRQMVVSQGRVGEATQDTQRKVSETSAGFQRFMGSLDSAYRAQMQFEAGQRRLNGALEAGMINTQQHNRLMELLQQRYMQVPAAATAAATGTRNFGQMIGQAGFQIQDFTVQVGAGQSAMVALAQQGSQFLGMFGPGGAVAGAILAIGAIAYNLLSAASATDQLNKAQQELISNLEKLEDLGDTDGEAQERRIERNRREADSVYARAKAEVTAYEDRLVRERREASLIADTLRADVRAGLKDAPDLLREQEDRIAAIDAVLERTRVRLTQIEGDYDRTLTRAGRNALEKTLDWVRDTAQEAAREGARAQERFEEQRRSWAQRYDRERLDAIIKRVAEEADQEEKAQRRREEMLGQYERRERERAEREWERFGDRAASTLADVLFDALTGKAANFWQVFTRLGLRAVADVAGQLLATSIISPVAQAGASAIGANNIGSLFSGASYLSGNSINALGAQYLGLADVGPSFVGPLMPGQTVGLTATSALGMAGLGFGAGYGLSSLTGSRAVGGIGGGLSGAAYGFYMGGPVGAAIGGVAGLAGGLLGGRGNRGNPYTQGQVALVDGRLVGAAAGDNGADPSGLQSQIDQGIASLEGIRSARGLVYSRGAGLFGDRTDRTIEQAFDEIASGLRPGAGTSAASAAVLNSGRVTGADSLVELLNRADSFDALSAALRNTFTVTNEAEQQFAALSAQLDAAKSFADEFGLSLNDVTSKMAGDFNDQIRRSILGITDANALALEDQDRTNAARLDLAKRIGADINQVERLNGLERAEIVRRAEEARKAAEEKAAAEAKAAREKVVGDARSTLLDSYNREAGALRTLRDQFEGFARSLGSFRQGLLTGSLSPLDSGGRLDAARANFRDIARRAQLGDVSAIADLQGASTSYLEASQDFYASSEQYYRDFQEVQGVLEGTESLAERQAQIAGEQLSVMESQLSQLGLLNQNITSFAQALLNYTKAAGVPAPTGTSGGGGAGGGSASGSDGLPPPSSPVVGGSHSGIGDSYRLTGDTLYFPGGGSHQVAGNPQALIDAYGLVAGPNGTMIRTRAMGGYTPAGLTLTGENGPEVTDFATPGRVYTTNQLAAAMSASGDMLAELRAVRQELAALRAITAQGALAVKAAVEVGNEAQADMASTARRRSAA